MSISRALYIDDRDPAIVYSSPDEDISLWRNSTGTTNEFMQTTRHANQTGATARINFIGASSNPTTTTLELLPDKGQGSDIAVYGSVSAAERESPDPLTYYILDSLPPATFRPTPTNDDQYNVLFYKSPSNLSTGLHTLHIVLQSVGNFWLDYMKLHGNVALAAGGNITDARAATTQVVYTVTHEHPQSLLTTSTSASSPTSPSGSPVSAEIIASSAVGGLLALILLAGLIIVIYRWRAAKAPRDLEGTLAPFTAAGTRSPDDDFPQPFSELNSSPITNPALSFASKRRLTTPGRLNLEPPPVYRSPRSDGFI